MTELAVNAFLFTDIVDSTPRWEQAPEAMVVELALHDDLLSEVVDRNGGRVVKRTGDGILAVFEESDAAIAAALDAQRSMLGVKWLGAEPLRVRIGLDRGAAHERDGDFFGPVVNRAARVMAAAGGTQIVLTADCRAGCASPPPGVSFVDLGEHRLKGLSRPQHLFELAHADLPADHEPIRSLNASIGNLPPRPGPIVGRAEERQAVIDALAASPLVTLVGPGGVGKTRVALEVAHDVAPAYPDGGWFVDLSSIAEPDALPELLGTTFGVQQRQGESMWVTLHDALANRRLLLVLDNCEHVLDDVTAFVQSQPAESPMRILATSREPLQCPRERRIRLETLATPSDARRVSVEEAAACSAVQLFVERAHAVDHRFTLDESNLDSVVDICHRLDGLPLAIELAAARLESLSIEAISKRLEASITLLRTTSTAVSARQRALIATLDWSFDLLDDPERALFARCSAFRGSFSVEAVEALMTRDSRVEAVDLVDQLVVKSMVHVDGSGIDQSEPRYRLLRPVAEYAAERLAERDERAATRDALAGHYGLVASEAGVALRSDRELEWITRLDLDVGNFRAALEWLAETDPPRALRMAVDLYAFWIDHDLLREGVRWLTVTRDGDPILVARALGLAAVLAFFLGENVAAERYARESVAVTEGVGEATRPEGQVVIASILLNRLEVDEAIRLCDLALETARSLEPCSSGAALSALAAVRALAGQAEEAVDIARESLAINRECGPGQRASALVNLAFTLQRTDAAEAVAVCEEAVKISSALGSRYFEAFARFQLGLASRTLGESRGALRAFAEALPLLRDVGLRNEAATVLEQIARLAATFTPEAAVVVYGAAAALREVVQLAGLPGEQLGRSRGLTRLREVISGPEFEHAWAEGRMKTLDEATDFAVSLADDVGALMPGPEI